jgi:hypothetical protein
LSSAWAQEGFRSPTGNIHCQFSAMDGDATIRCDLRQVSNRSFPRPRNCDLEFGQGVRNFGARRARHAALLRRHGAGRSAAGAALRPELAARRSYLHFGAKRRVVPECPRPWVYVVAGGAERVLAALLRRAHSIGQSDQGIKRRCNPEMTAEKYARALSFSRVTKTSELCQSPSHQAREAERRQALGCSGTHFVSGL